MGNCPVTVAEDSGLYQVLSLKTREYIFLRILLLLDFARMFQTFYECVCIVSLVSSLLGSMSSFYHDFVCKILKKSLEITGGQRENQHYERLVRCLPK